MTFRLSKSEKTPGGVMNTATWRKIVGRSVVVKCPRCAQIAHISTEDHEIRDDGTVHPSLVCPNPTCDFHEFVQLEEWDGWRKKKVSRETEAGT